MTEKNTDLQNASLAYFGHEFRSRRFLEQIDEIDAKIATCNQCERFTLQQDRQNICEAFAKHLGNQEYVARPSLRAIVPAWRVRGVPSKKHRKQANEWMNLRGVEWNGSARQLCTEIRNALERNEVIPEHNFGLKPFRTVDIKEPRAFSTYALGQLRHYKEPATELTPAQRREDEWFMRQFSDED